MHNIYTYSKTICIIHVQITMVIDYFLFRWFLVQMPCYFVLYANFAKYYRIAQLIYKLYLVGRAEVNFIFQDVYVTAAVLIIFFPNFKRFSSTLAFYLFSSIFITCLLGGCFSFTSSGHRFFSL